jgi:hypothetical protein
MTPAEKRDQQDRARRYARQVLHYRIKETQACGYAVQGHARPRCCEQQATRRNRR